MNQPESLQSQKENSQSSLFSFQQRLQYLPVVVFVLAFAIGGKGEKGFEFGFYASGVLSLFTIIFYSIKKYYDFNRLIIGLGLFFIVGAMVYLIGGNETIVSFNRYMEVSFFSCVFLVGLAANFITPWGFANLKVENLKDHKIFNHVLLLITALAVILSILFHGHTFWGALLPFFLIVFGRILIDYTQK